MLPVVVVTLPARKHSVSERKFTFLLTIGVTAAAGIIATILVIRS